MAKVTSKLQVTIPKTIAVRYRIHPGDEIEWLEAGDTIRVLPSSRVAPQSDARERLALFDAATARQRTRQRRRPRGATPVDRGWTRAELYDRGRAR